MAAPARRRSSSASRLIPHFVKKGPRNEQKVDDLVSLLKQGEWNNFEAAFKKIKSDFWDYHSAEFISALIAPDTFEKIIELKKINAIYKIIHGNCNIIYENRYLDHVITHLHTQARPSTDTQFLYRCLKKDNHIKAKDLFRENLTIFLRNQDKNGLSAQLKDPPGNYWTDHPFELATFFSQEANFESIISMDALTDTYKELRGKIDQEHLIPFIDHIKEYILKSSTLKADFVAFADTLKTTDKTLGESLQEGIDQKIIEQINYYQNQFSESLRENNAELFTQTLAETPSYLWEDQGLQIVSILCGSIPEIDRMGLLPTTHSKIKNKTSDGCQKQFMGAIERWNTLKAFIESLQQPLQSKNCDGFIQALDAIPPPIWKSFASYLLFFLTDSLSEIKTMEMLEIVDGWIEKNTSEACITQFKDAVESWTLAQQEECKAEFATLTIDLP